MSEENVEVVRAASQAWNAGDMDAFRELHDPDVILRTEKNWPEPGPYTGREAVLCFVRQAGRGRQSGVPVEIHFFEVFTIRDEKVRKAEFFRHRADALEAAGVSE
jgi:ketosteroid isomerase-like protein